MDENNDATLPGSDEPEPSPPAARLAYIEDDLVLEGTFPGTNILPEVNFRFHPVNSIEDAEWANKVMGSRGNRKDLYRTIMRHVSQHLRSWDLKKAVKTPDGSISYEVVNHRDLKELDRVAPAVIDYIHKTIQESAEDVHALGKKSPGLFGSQ